MTSIIASIITAIVTIITVVLNNRVSNAEIQHKLETQQAVFETKLENLTAEVREHNNYAQRVPILEEKIAVANKRIDDLERDNRENQRKVSKAD